MTDKNCRSCKWFVTNESNSFMRCEWFYNFSQKTPFFSKTVDLKMGTGDVFYPYHLSEAEIQKSSSCNTFEESIEYFTEDDWDEDAFNKWNEKQNEDLKTLWNAWMKDPEFVELMKTMKTNYDKREI